MSASRSLRSTAARRSAATEAAFEKKEVKSKASTKPRATVKAKRGRPRKGRGCTPITPLVSRVPVCLVYRVVEYLLCLACVLSARVSCTSVSRVPCASSAI